MQCPDCGYMMTAFDKECARCQKLGMPLKPCLKCGGTVGIREEYCSWCHHRFGDPVEPPAPTNVYASPAIPVAQTLQVAPDYSQPPAYPPPVYPQAAYPQAPVHVTVSNGSNAGWLAAAMVLLLATPLGCLVIPVSLICGALVLLVGWSVWPILATAGAAVAVVRAPPQSVPQDKKVYLVLAIVALGVIIEAVWIQGRQQ